MIVEPGATFTVYADLEASGLEGTAGVTVYEGDAIVTARTTAGIAQLGSSTIYAITITAPTAEGYYVANGDDGTTVQWPSPFQVAEEAAALNIVEPLASLTIYADLEDIGLEGTAGVTVYEGDTIVTARTTAGIAQLGSSTIYAVTVAAPEEAGYYVASVDDGVDVQWPWPFRVSADLYVTTTELFRVLKIRDATAAQIAAGVRVLTAATGEVDSEIDFAAGADPLFGWQLALAAEVTLERAVEHWQQGGTPFGLLGLGAETGVAFASADSWKRHALKLAPLKQQWGFS